MLSALLPLVYVQISPELLTVKNVKSGTVVSELPEVAVSTEAKARILAVGPQARLAAASGAAQVSNPFAHPRTLVSDFTLAEQLIKHQLRRVLSNHFWMPAPCVVMHPIGKAEGGYTQVERRAFREMALGAGASQVFVWIGRPLTDTELLSRRAPEGPGEWE
jgi:rod shape-determining protein MreB